MIKKKTTKKRATKSTRKVIRRKKTQGLIKVTSPVKKDVAFYVASELADDKLIGQELLGQTTKTLVYEFENESKEVVRGLSYQGVREAVRIINRDKASGHIIQVSDRPPIVERNLSMNGQDGVEIQIYAIDLEGGGGSWGIKFEPYQKSLGDGKGSTVFNRFAIETALSKAQRNAMFNLLPAELIEKIIDKFAKKKENVIQIDAPKITTREVKPKQTINDKMYKITLERVTKVKGNEQQLEKALEKVDEMLLTGKQKGMIRRKIKSYLKKI